MLLAISAIVILLVLTFNLGKDSDTLDFKISCSNNSIQYSIPKRCDNLYSNMYSYCQYGSVYSEILLWGLFSTYCIQTKELQMIFPIIVAVLTIVCVIWNTYINVELWKDGSECHYLIHDYDELSSVMFILNTVIFSLIVLICLVLGIYCVKKKNRSRDEEKMIDDL